MTICGLSIHLSLVNFTTVQINKTEQTRSNPAVLPQNSTSENRYDFRGKTPRDVELEDGIVRKLVVSRPRLAFFDTFDESFHRTSRVTAESAGARQAIIFACEFDMSS